MRTASTDVETLPATAPPAEEQAQEAISDRERRIVLWLNNINHLLNHFQNQMVFVMYPTIAAEFGMGPLQLSFLTVGRSVFNNWVQLGWGFATPFVQRFRLLAITSLVSGLGTFSSGLAFNFLSLLGVRCVAAAGSSAMHPVGTSLLASYFPKNRGAVLALNATLSQVGSILAPLIGGILLIAVGWRYAFFAVAVLSIFMALAYFLFRDKVRGAGPRQGSGRAKLAASRDAYFRVLTNKNVLLVALVMLVGGAGRGEVTPTYLPLHLMNDFGPALEEQAIPVLGFLPFLTQGSVIIAGVITLALFLYQVGGLAGPLTFGWISDRTSRKGVTQVSLLLSGLATLTLAWLGPSLLAILGTMVLYGAVTHSRGTLTQAIVADSVSEQDQDAAYSMYFFLGFFSAPLWALITGFLFQTFSFSVAFSVMACSYVAGMFLMSFVTDNRPARESFGRRVY